LSRTLASIQRITDIQPIPDADAIEVASVLGWKVVVKKGEYQVGDLAVYLEIDSVPPDEEQYRFLWKFADQRPNNFRIKTIKLRGQISQGILFPLNQFTDPFVSLVLEEVVGGEDVTSLLGITKYEAPLPGGSSNVEGQFFDGVPKTDEERVQSSTGAKHLAALQGRPYYITVKCDGSSMTVAMHDGEPKVASRNYRLSDVEGSAYYAAARNSGGWASPLTSALCSTSTTVTRAVIWTSTTWLSSLVSAGSSWFQCWFVVIASQIRRRPFLRLLKASTRGLRTSVRES